MQIRHLLLSSLVLASIACTTKTREIQTQFVHDPAAPAPTAPATSPSDSNAVAAPATDNNGGVSDGGGQAVVCRSADGVEVTQAELVDLWETEVTLDMKLQEPVSNDYIEIPKQVAANIDRGGSGTDPVGVATNTSDGKVTYRGMGLPITFDPRPTPISSDLATLDLHKRLLPPKVKLKTLTDANVAEMPSGNCAIEQLARYDDRTSRLEIVGDIWEKLDATNKAALLIHESLYRALRSNGETTSDRTRRAVGLAFTGYQFNWLLDGVPQDALRCNSTDEAMSYRFFAYRSPTGGTTLQFVYFAGQLQLSRTLLNVSTAYGPFATPPADELSRGGDVVFELDSPLNGNPAVNVGVKADNGKLEFHIRSTLVDPNNLQTLTYICR